MDSRVEGRHLAPKVEVEAEGRATAAKISTLEGHYSSGKKLHLS